MASSVLGKRTRASTGAVGNPDAPAAKRRAKAEIFDDGKENENPFITRPKRRRIPGPKVIANEESENINCVNGVAKARLSQCLKSAGARLDTSTSGNEENSNPFQIPTPQTPRHRDALSKKVPVTPRFRVQVQGTGLASRTPRTPSSSGGSQSTVYNVARQLFTHSRDPGPLVGRDAERTELHEFVDGHIQSLSGGCLYISGPPGTGKSALVREVTESLPANSSIRKAYINCMSIKTSKDIYGTLLETLNAGDGVKEGDELQALDELFVSQGSSTTTFVITLDEIDHLLTLNVEFLYKLFEWAVLKSSHLVLVGIANALDLTDRFLPRLKARNIKPRLLPFLPYSAAQIKAVITCRLKSTISESSSTPGYIPFLHPAAVELCSRKVASQTGDLRKALDICRRAIDLVEMETKQKLQKEIDEQLQDSPSRQPLGENINSSAPPTRSSPAMTLPEALARLTAESAPRASISHLNKVTTAAFNTGASQRLKSLNLQQKAALCALIALEKKKRDALSSLLATPSKSAHLAPSVKTLYDTYCKLCRRDSQLQPLTSTEFRDVISSLETLSIISAVDSKSGSFLSLSTPSKRGRKTGFGGGIGSGDEKRVASCVGERELEQSLDGKGGEILRGFLCGQDLDWDLGL